MAVNVHNDGHGARSRKDEETGRLSKQVGRWRCVNTGP